VVLLPLGGGNVEHQLTDKRFYSLVLWASITLRIQFFYLLILCHPFDPVTEHICIALVALEVEMTINNCWVSNTPVLSPLLISVVVCLYYLQFCRGKICHDSTPNSNRHCEVPCFN